jgi:hypothetical protein
MLLLMNAAAACVAAASLQPAAAAGGSQQLRMTERRVKQCREKQGARRTGEERFGGIVWESL